jgi:hypothetical protein
MGRGLAVVGQWAAPFGHGTRRIRRWRLGDAFDFKGEKQMTQYILGVPGCNIRQIRSLRSDTLVASVGLRVMNAQGGLHHDWPAQSANLGDYEALTFVDTNLFYRGIDVPDPTPQLPDGGAIYWSFILANAGHGDNSVLLSAANNAANAVVGALVSSGDITAEFVAGGIIGVQALLQLLTADCDGVVAALGFGFTAAELAQMTADPKNWLKKVNCPGTDSPVGCGDNSNYDVYYLITNRSLTTVPNLIGKSPKAADSLAQQAGLFLSSISSQTGSPREAPHVDDQNPAPGSQVPPATWITATIIYPPPHNGQTP